MKNAKIAPTAKRNTIIKNKLITDRTFEDMSLTIFSILSISINVT